MQVGDRTVCKVLLSGPEKPALSSGGMECSDSTKTTIKKVIIFTKISKSSKGLSRGRNHSQNSTQLAQDSSVSSFVLNFILIGAAEG